MQGYLNSDQVCALLGISKPTLWKLGKNGRLCPRRVGRYNEYPEAEVQNFLANCPPSSLYGQSNQSSRSIQHNQSSQSEQIIQGNQSVQNCQSCQKLV